MPKTAYELAREQRKISVAEFFEKNRHLMGYDNPAKALLTSVKEAVDNGLDASEDAGLQPRIEIWISKEARQKYKVRVRDLGPGIVKSQIPRIFCKLLYGSKFHQLRQSRGQQGMGISSACLYGQLTTGEPVCVRSKTAHGKLWKLRMKIDVPTNKPVIIEEEQENSQWDHGTDVSLLLEGKWMHRYHSVHEYLKQTAIVNPHASIKYHDPEGKDHKFKAATEKIPARPIKIKPHPHGIELGILSRMLKSAKENTLSGFLRNELTRVGSKSARQMLRLARLDSTRSPQSLDDEEVKKLLKAMRKVKLQRPPTDCLSPIGKELIEEGLKKEVGCEFIATTTRKPTVYRGVPFQLEAGIGWGGDLEEKKQKKVKIIRFADKVPLLYQRSDCAITKSIKKVKWKRYGLDQSGGEIPRGPAIILVHLCSIWVPYTSESKQSIASYPEILKEIKLSVQECGRKLALYLGRKKRAKKELARRGKFERYLPLIAENAKKLAGSRKKLKLKPILNKITSKKLVNED